MAILKCGEGIVAVIKCLFHGILLLYFLGGIGRMIGLIVCNMIGIIYGDIWNIIDRQGDKVYIVIGCLIILMIYIWKLLCEKKKRIN